MSDWSYLRKDHRIVHAIEGAVFIRKEEGVKGTGGSPIMIYL